MQKIVMPDLFDMKPWEGNNCREWMLETNILGKRAWRGSTEQQFLKCSMSLQHAGVIKSAESRPPYRQGNVRVTAGPLRTVDCAEVLLGHSWDILWECDTLAWLAFLTEGPTTLCPTSQKSTECESSGVFGNKNKHTPRVTEFSGN